MNDTIKEQVSLFVEKRVGVKVDDKTLFFEDLGIDGLDAESFMEDFAKQFNIDMSSFDGGKYYFSEYELGNIFLKVFWAFLNRKKLKKSNFDLLHLTEVARKGKWFSLPG